MTSASATTRLAPCITLTLTLVLTLPATTRALTPSECATLVDAVTYDYCTMTSSFAFDGNSTTDTGEFCANPGCLDLAFELQYAGALSCLSVPGVEELLTGKDALLLVDCSSYDSPVDYTLLSATTYGKCTEDLRRQVDDTVFQECATASGFSFDGRNPIATSAFCGASACVSLVDSLRAVGGAICMDVPGMEALVNFTNNGVALSCEGVSDALDFSALPTGDTRECPQVARKSVTVADFRGCKADAGFTFASDVVTDADAFCRSSSCQAVYSSLLDVNPQTAASCVDVPGMKAGVTVGDREGSWCSLTGATSPSSGPSAIVWILVAVGGVVVVVVAIVGYCMWKRRRQTSGETYNGSTNPERSPAFRKFGDGPSNQATTNESGTSGVTTVWDDEEIQSARIPYEKLIFGEMLSRGGYGQVYRGTYRGKRVAIKTLLPEVRKDKRQIQILLDEVKMMAAMDHPRIVTFIGVAWDSIKELCLVTEFMNRGDLRGVLTSFDDASSEWARPRGFDADKVRIAFHVVHALAYLHTLEPMVLHRDLKSRNILLDDKLNAKVTDFGVSRERVDRTMTVGVGTSLWIAPEVMLGGRYDERADVYSCGVVLSELDTHELPYAGVTEPGTATRLPDAVILQMVASGRIRVAFSQPREQCAMTQLAHECVATNPEDRPTTAELLHRVNRINQQYRVLV